MPVLDRDGTQIWRRRTTGESLVRWFGWLIGVAIFVYCWQIISASTTWFFVWDAPRIANDIWTRATGVASALISDFGFFASHDVRAAIKQANIVPNFVVTRP